MEAAHCVRMVKRYLPVAILLGVLALLASQFFARPELRAFFSVDYWQSLLRFERVLRLVESEYVDGESVDFERLTDRALKEAVGGLDAYSAYMTREDYEAFNMASEQQYVGIGIRVIEVEGGTIVAEVFADGSAAEAGLQVGDRIVEVDGETVRDAGLEAVVAKLRGVAETEVTIGVERSGTGDPIRLSVARRPISISPVAGVEMKSASIGYVQVRQFVEKTRIPLIAAIETLKGDGMKALILDLRSNPGGRLDAAVELAELFLPDSKRVVTVRSRRGVEETFRVPSGGAADVHKFEGPLVVLIDGGSASASEILAGALRDHDRAILVGESSFGKGSVQSVFSFRGGDGLKLTSARYVLPSGAVINGDGVAPNKRVEQTVDAAMPPALQSLHLAAMGPETFKAIFGVDPVEDKQLQEAVRLLEEGAVP